MTDSNELIGEEVIFKPIGYATTWFQVKNATPRQPTVSTLTRGSIKISKNVFSNPEHSLETLDQFSHLWILFLFHKNGTKCTKAKVSPPRLNGTRVGVFSTRSPHRPNPIGLTLAKIESVEGDTIHLSGLDLLDGTPVIDIKPFIPSYDSPSNSDDSATAESTIQMSKIPSWTSLKTSSALHVNITESALSQIASFSQNPQDPNYKLGYLKNYDEAVRAIKDILSEDPRSVYRKTKCQDRLYFCIIDTMHITSWFDEVNNKCEVIRVMPYAVRQAFNKANQTE